MKQLTKADQKEAARINVIKGHNPELAQKCADIWMRSAPTKAIEDRRKEAVRNMGLSDTIEFI